MTTTTTSAISTILDLNLCKANLTCMLNILESTETGSIPFHEGVGMQEKAFPVIGHMHREYQEFCDEIDRIST